MSVLSISIPILLLYKFYDFPHLATGTFIGLFYVFLVATIIKEYDEYKHNFKLIEKIAMWLLGPLAIAFTFWNYITYKHSTKISKYVYKYNPNPNKV